MSWVASEAVQMARMLDYGHKKRRGIDRRTTRWLVGLSLLFALIWAGARWIPELRRYVESQRMIREHQRFVTEALAAQQACMEFSLPPSTVVYSEDPAEVTALGATGEPYATYPDELSWTGRRDDHPPQRVVRARWCAECKSFDAATGRAWGVGFFGWTAPAFMHHRQSAGGHDRLVVVSLSDWGVLNPVVITPATSANAPSSARGQDAAMFLRRFGQAFRIFAGQVDLNDPSHFSFRYTYGARNGTIDAYLEDNDTVRFRVDGVEEAVLARHSFYLEHATPLTATSPSSRATSH